MDDPELERIKKQKMEAWTKKPTQTHPSVIKADSSSFDQIVSENKMAIVDFWAEWCGPCRMMSPVMEELSKKYTNVTFAKLNVDENPGIAQRFGVQGIPTFIFFRGGKPAASLVGAVGKDGMDKFIQKNSV